ncbi:DUF1349 domain-containing protein [Actinomadura macrotermitis]|uniref:DUF1349 domain-containing protein n=1 Tax=Actinomadura macrotermitis TaxID=2585200 RepID=A0A7K0BNM7_9ACTN|nr:ABC transporter permease subunit [Actinomadura macrotermitis]MQY02666.1 hypothetical protein [Actinomadura macrotermitis]
MTGDDGFARLLRAEWTKLRTVPRWGLTLLAAVALTLLIAVLSASGDMHKGGGGPEAPPGAPRKFELRDLPAGGTVTARVAALTADRAWAKAGLIVRRGDQRHGPHVAIMVTQGHGVRMQSGGENRAAGSGGAPRWLRLTRAGTTVTGYVSADGRTWQRAGRFTVGGLTGTVQAGLFVASPDDVKVVRQFGGESISGQPTGDGNRAFFDNAAMTPAPAAPWPAGRIELAGGGDIGPDRFAGDETRRALSGTLIGQAAIIALAVLFVSAEYRRGMIRTTFLASPRRGRVLAAKAVVLGAVAAAAGLAAGFGSFLLGGGNLPPLSDGAALRALLGTGLLFGVIALFALGIGALVRHGAAAITIALVLLLAPYIVATGLPVSAAVWLGRLTPAAGFAVQQTIERYDTAIGPWAGLGVLCCYAAAALGAAAWRLRATDA